MSCLLLHGEYAQVLLGLLPLMKQTESSVRTHGLPGDHGLVPRCRYFHILDRKLYCNASVLCLMLFVVCILATIWHLDLSKHLLPLNTLVWGLLVVVMVSAVLFLLIAVWVVLRAVCRLLVLRSMIVLVFRLFVCRIPISVGCPALLCFHRRL